MTFYLSLLLLIATSMGAAATTASENEIVFDQQIRISNPLDATAEFVANLKDKQLGRAWVRLSYSDGDFPNDGSYEVRSIDVAVPGLKFDPEQNEIYLKTAGGKRVPCAKNVKKSFWRGQAFDDTNLCHLKARVENAGYDNGFYIRRAPGVHVTLGVER